MHASTTLLDSTARRHRFAPRLAFACVFLFLAVLSFRAHDETTTPGIVCCGVLLLCAGIFRDVALTPAGRVVIFLRVWDILPIWRRELPPEVVSGILIRHQRGADDDLWAVGVLLRSGRFIFVQGFYSAAGVSFSSHAQSFAQELIEFTHLPFCGTTEA
jgi:hypothetical protein